MRLKLLINGEEYEVDNCLPSTSLADVLRERLNLTGTKRGCDTGGCGMCTVLLDWRAVYSCMTPAWRAEGSRVLTVEGLGDEKRGVDPLQEAFERNFAPQCGYCTPAMLLAGKSFLNRVSSGEEQEITEERIRDALCGVVCRCTGYLPYIKSVSEVAREMVAAKPLQEKEARSNSLDSPMRGESQKKG